jgi:hypothetical protein
MLINIKRANFFLLCCLIANVATLPALTAHANPHATYAPTLGNDDTTFVFAARCPNGEPYRLSAYQMEIDGLSQSFYDFEGPAGKGTIRTNTEPKKMVTRVCRNLADIQDGSKFD